MKHFPRAVVMALPDDGYTSTPKKARIVRQGDDEHPWVLDAYDDTTGAYTEQMWTFPTFAEAVTEVPEFCAQLAEFCPEVMGPMNIQAMIAKEK